MAAAAMTPVSVMETAGEGGPWGMALLASYMTEGKGESLEEYLERRVFADTRATTIEPDEADVKGFQAYMKRYRAGLAAERAAVEAVRG